MKNLLVMFLLLVSIGVEAQPAPTFEASAQQAADGTVGAPFYISPRRQLATNGLTAVQVAAKIGDTNDNIILPLIVSKVPISTNNILMTNVASAVIGQVLVLTGTNTSGQWFAKPTNVWSSGSTPNGLVTNSAVAPIIVTDGVNTPSQINTNSISSAAISTTTATITTVNATTVNGNGSGLTNSRFNGLKFTIATNAFTNIIVGYFTLTNNDGLVMQVLGGTNIP